MSADALALFRGGYLAADGAGRRDRDAHANVCRSVSEARQLLRFTLRNHATMDERRLREMFPKSLRADVKARLSVNKRKLFDLMIHGKHAPDWKWLAEVRRDALGNTASATARPMP